MSIPSPTEPNVARITTMSFPEVVASGVLYSPFEVTQLPHETKDMPKKTFKELCNEHAISTLDNAKHIVRLWNNGHEVPKQAYCLRMGTDVEARLAWFLEEEVGLEEFWQMLKQQATPPIQPDHALMELWNLARHRRTMKVRQRAIQFYTETENAPPTTSSDQQ
jgi:hypothetical protein